MHRVDYLSVASPLSDNRLAAAAALLQQAVSDGAALGWVRPPSDVEVSDLLAAVVDDVATDDAALILAEEGGQLVGLGYWRRYHRPTHRPHADVERIVVAPAARGQGVGRGLMLALIAAARAVDVEVLTLDMRADNSPAVGLYESLGFRRYGMLPRFVAVGDRRYDKWFYALDLRVPSPRHG